METSRIEIIDSSWGNAQGEYKLSPSVLFVVALDRSGRLFDLDDSFYAVEAVGVRMLCRALGEDRATTVASMARRHGVAPERIGQDYDAFLQDLVRRNLILPRTAAPAAAAPPSRRAAIFLRPLVAVIRRQPLPARAWGLLAAARIFIRLFGWDETRRAWLELPARWAASPPVDEDAIAEAIRRAAARHLLGVSCKERSLACWALCRMAGIPAAVVLGISLFPLASHCWCETASACLTDFPDRCEAFTPVLKYA